MSIEKKPFVSYQLDEEKDTTVVTITMKLNLQEQAELIKFKKLLQQDKNSTAIKQLMRIGQKVLLDEKITEIIGIILNNKRKNAQNKW